MPQGQSHQGGPTTDSGRPPEASLGLLGGWETASGERELGYRVWWVMEGVGKQRRGEGGKREKKGRERGGEGTGEEVGDALA